MSTPAVPVTEEQLLAAHRELAQPVSFETMKQCPALLICLRNLAEIRQRRRVEPPPSFAAPVPRRTTSQVPARVFVDRKRAAANDID